MIVGQCVLTFLSVYAQQCGPSDADKDLIYDQLRAVTTRIPALELLTHCGDWNGYVGRTVAGFREVCGGFVYGTLDPDTEGQRILEYALAYDLRIGNTCFKKQDSHLITYKSGQAATQIDYIMFRKRMRNFVKEVKVIPGEEVAPQHQLLVCDMQMARPPNTKRKFFPRLKV